MKSQSYITFRWHELTYGVEISLVREIFQLPELSIVPETPKDIIGVLYLRNRNIPIMHLDRRLGEQIQPCQVSDRVILIESQGVEMGIIVNDVLEVLEISSDNINSEPDYGRDEFINTAFVDSIAKVNQQPIILLNAKALIRQPEVIETLITEIGEDLPEESLQDVSSNFFDYYCNDVDESEKAIFRQRAQELSSASVEESNADKLPVAIFGLDDRYFSFNLNLVKEFIDIEQITPVPLCPNHILGNINLRGEIVTVIDIRSKLSSADSCESSSSQGIVVEVGDISAVIAVDEVYDVSFLDEGSLDPIPSKAVAENQDYFYGVTTYQDQILSALNLAEMFQRGNLVLA